MLVVLFIPRRVNTVPPFSDPHFNIQCGGQGTPPNLRFKLPRLGINPWFRVFRASSCFFEDRLSSTPKSIHEITRNNTKKTFVQSHLARNLTGIVTEESMLHATPTQRD
jgi:hypothetical protein